MCNYSLHNVASRSAKIGDQLVTTEFAYAVTRGFASFDDPMTAVCLSPGTELVFDSSPRYSRPFTRWLPAARPGKLASKFARFRLINMDRREAHHDALEFAHGATVLLTRLCPGQRATVLQLPRGPQKMTPTDKQKRLVEETNLVPAGWSAGAKSAGAWRKESSECANIA